MFSSPITRRIKNRQNKSGCYRLRRRARGPCPCPVHITRSNGRSDTTPLCSRSSSRLALSGSVHVVSVSRTTVSPFPNWVLGFVPFQMIFQSVKDQIRAINKSVSRGHEAPLSRCVCARVCMCMCARLCVREIKLRLLTLHREAAPDVHAHMRAP